MKRILYLLILLVSHNLSAQPFKLVKDINTSTSFYYQTQSMGGLLELNGYLYLPATYSPYGGELWRVDKLTGIKNLVKDIYPGMEGSDISSWIVFNNLIYFSANNGILGNELWRTDGTAEGTVLVKDIAPGTSSSFPGNFIVNNNILFFSAQGELWKSDGTESGTILVKDIYPGENPSSPSNFCIKDGILYFVANDPVFGRELWRSDGSQNGTYLVYDIYSGSEPYIGPNNGNPGLLTVYNGYLFFAANNYTNGRELWRSDGTGSGTFMLKDLYPGRGPSNPNVSKLVFNNKLYFTITNSAYRSELWTTDGTIQGTVKADGFPTELSVGTPFYFKGSLFVFCSSQATGREIWKTDGSAAGTVKFLDLNSTGEHGFAVTDNNFYFVDWTQDTGAEPWVSDGTVQGTKLLKDLEPGQSGSNITYVQLLNGQVYFRTQTSLYGTSIWKTDGSDTGTTNFVSYVSGTLNSNPAKLTAYRNKVYFSANDSLHGEELWCSDGTEGGTFLLKDIVYGVAGSYPRNLIVSDTLLYFNSFSRLWKTNGTSAGTEIVHPTVIAADEKMITSNGILYFRGSDGSNNRIWKSNGTAQGTKPMEVGTSDYLEVYEMAAFKGTVFFRAYNYSAGSELWKIDTVTSRAVLVKDIDPGPLNGSPGTLTIAGNYLYFVAFTSTNGPELWRTDGTEAGTIILEVLPGSSGSISGLITVTSVGDEVFFIASDSVHGNELWKSNGTPGGTIMVKDIVPGIGSSTFAHLICLNGVLYFDVYDTEHGYELWKTDGTPNGTVLVKESWPGKYGNGNGDVVSLFKPGVANETIILTRSDEINGQEPWFSNGTEAGTMMIQDIFPGTGSSIPNDYIVAGDKIFFTANMPGFGVELWAGNINDIFPRFQLTFNGSLQNQNAFLDWQTTHERLLNRFEIQRSIDRISFVKVGQLNSKGGLGISAAYSFVDSNVTQLNQKLIHYRLGIRDTSGSYSYSDTVGLTIPDIVTSNSIKAWPIPTPGDLNISIALVESDDINFVMYDIQGRAVQKWGTHFEKGITTKTIHLQALNAGVYYLSAQGRSLQQIIKLIKM